MSRSAEVDSYVSALPPLRAERLTAIRDAVHAAWPDVAERIEWKMPVFARGERWVAAASQKSYVSVYLHAPDIAARIAAGDPKLKNGKGCLNVPDGAALPVEALAGAFRTLLA